MPRGVEPQGEVGCGSLRCCLRIDAVRRADAEAWFQMVWMIQDRVRPARIGVAYERG